MICSTEFDFREGYVLSVRHMSVETGGGIPARIEALLKSPTESRPPRMERLLEAKSRALNHLRREGCVVVPFQGDELLEAPQSWNCVCGFYAIPMDRACSCGATNPKL
jgi:hypothetical protein